MVDEPSSDSTWPAPPWAAPSAVADEQKAVMSSWPAPSQPQFPTPQNSVPTYSAPTSPPVPALNMAPSSPTMAIPAPQPFTQPYVAQQLPGAPWQPPLPVWQPSVALYTGYTSLYAGDDATGRLPLRPMKVTEVVDASFKLLRGRFWSLVLAAIAIAVPLGIFRVWASETFQRSEYSQTFGLNDDGDFATISSAEQTTSYFGILLGYVAVLVASQALSLVLSRVVSDAYHAKRTRLQGAWKATTSRWPVASGAIAITSIPWFGGLGVLALSGADTTSSPAIVLTGIVLIVFVVFVNPRLYPLIPVVSLDRLGVRDSLNRTLALTKKSAARIFGLSLVLGFASAAVGFALALPFSAMLAIFEKSTMPYQAMAVMSEVAASAVQLPLIAISTTLVYFDLKIRNEGYDLEVIAKTLQEQEEMASS